MSNLDKIQINAHFERWDDLKGKIEKHYNEKNKEAVVLMQEAIENYAALLDSGGTAVDARTGVQGYALLPLNGAERFAFVKDKIQSHYAYIQLDALYSETRKKVARLTAMR